MMHSDSILFNAESNFVRALYTNIVFLCGRKTMNRKSLNWIKCPELIDSIFFLFIEYRLTHKRQRILKLYTKET